MATVYSCVNCGGALRFDIASNQMACDYCNALFEIRDSKHEYEEAKMSVYTFHCPTCGAELLGDQDTAATFCLFCGNPTLNQAVLSEELKPAKIIPFKKTKQEAKAIFRNWVKQGKLTPDDFASETTIDKITGLYVPFWLYDCDAKGSLTGMGRLEADHATSHAGSNKKTITTSYYLVKREMEIPYAGIPVDASIEMEDSLMDRVEPYDYFDMEEFDMAYLSGFLAEKFNYSEQDLLGRAEMRAKGYIRNEIRQSLSSYTCVDASSESETIYWKKTEYAMLPVWMLNYKYRGVNYEIAINGQTGRIVGQRPVDERKRKRLRATVFVLIFLLTTVVLFPVYLFVYGYIKSMDMGIIEILGIAVLSIASGITLAVIQTKRVLNKRLREQVTNMSATGSDYKVGRPKKLCEDKYLRTIEIPSNQSRKTKEENVLMKKLDQIADQI